MGIHIEDTKEQGFKQLYYFSVPERSTLKTESAKEQAETADDLIKVAKAALTDGYVKELYKWKTVLEMLKNGFPVHNRINEFCDMSLDEIYEEYEAMLNHIFINADDDVQSYSLADGIYDLIDELDAGIAVGLPYNNMDILNKETGGQLPGNITLIGGLSNMGKTTLTRSMLIPSTIKYGERLVIAVNEEGIRKWQRELLVWVANNIYKQDLQKFVVRDMSDDIIYGYGYYGGSIYESNGKYYMRYSIGSSCD